MSEAQLKILKMVEEGKISAADAVGLIEALKRAEEREENKTSRLRDKHRDLRKEREEHRRKLKDKIKEEIKKHKDEAHKIKLEIKQQIKDDQEKMKEDLKNMKIETDIQFDADELEKEIKENVMENLFAVVSGIPKMVKKSMKFGHKVESQEVDFEGKDSIQLKLVSGDLELQKSKDDKIHMVCETLVPIDKELEKENGTLKMSFTYGDVRLSIPENLKNLKIDIVSGDIEGEFSAEDIDINSISGDVCLKVGKYNDLSLKTKSGDINIAVPEIEETAISIKTMSGDIRVDGLDMSSCCSGKHSNTVSYTPDDTTKHTLAVSSLAGDILVQKNNEG